MRKDCTRLVQVQLHQPSNKSVSEYNVEAHNGIMKMLLKSEVMAVFTKHLLSE